MKIFIQLTLSCLWGWMLCGQAMASPIMIRLYPNATVVGPNIDIGDVADLIGSGNGDVDRVRLLEVGKAAPADTTASISTKQIQICLLQNGFSLSDFDFDGAPVSKVLTKSQDFYPSSLLPQIKKFVLQQVNEDPKDVEVQLAGEDQKMVLPAGKITASFRPTFSGQYEGEVLLTAQLDINRTQRILPLRLNIEVYHPLAVTTKRVEKDETFTEQNVALRRVPISRLSSGGFNQLNYVLGRKAAMPLIPGTILQVMSILNPPVIIHGSIVEGVVQSGNVELQVEVRAIQDGKAGDEILVENTNSHKVLKGKVLNEKMVLLDQNGP